MHINLEKKYNKSQRRTLKRNEAVSQSLEEREKRKRKFRKMRQKAKKNRFDPKFKISRYKREKNLLYK